MIFSLSTKAGHLMDFFFLQIFCAIVLKKKKKKKNCITFLKNLNILIPAELGQFSCQKLTRMNCIENSQSSEKIIFVSPLGERDTLF